MEPVSFVTAIATKVASSFIAKKLKQFTDETDKQAFIKELDKTIHQAIYKYKETAAKSTSNLIGFYESQKIVELLIHQSLTDDIDIEQVHAEVSSDVRIAPARMSDLQDFLELFFNLISANKNLTSLNINANYKEEVFKIRETQKEDSKNINKILEWMNDQKNNGVNTILVEEWKTQLLEIQDELTNFKPKTAIRRLENLEQRIGENIEKLDSDISARLFFLKALCKTELNRFSTTKETAELFIRAYELNPDDEAHKARAAISYSITGKKDLAESIANEILDSDPVSISAWMAKCYCHEHDWLEFIKQIPNSVYSDHAFKISLGIWLLQKKLVQSFTELELYDLLLDKDEVGIPERISFKNRSFWTLYIEHTLNKFYSFNQLLNHIGYLDKTIYNEDLRHSQKVILIIASAVKGSEVEDGYTFYQFESHYIDFLLDKNQSSVLEMEKLYGKAVSHGGYLSVIHMSQGLNFINTPQSRKKAISIIEEYGEAKEETLAILNTINKAISKDWAGSKKSFYGYLELVKPIDESIIYNVLMYFKGLAAYVPEMATEQLKELKTGYEFTDLLLKDFLDILVYSALNEGNISDKQAVRLEEIADKYDSDQAIRITIAQLYISSRNFDAAVNLLKDHVKENTITEDLRYYCIAQFNGSADKKELLEFIEKYRTTEEYDIDLLSMELLLRKGISDWQEAFKIVKKGLQLYPNERIFKENLVFALEESFDSNSVIEYKLLLIVLAKEYPNLAVNISKLLLKAKLTEDSFLVLYTAASSPNNKGARFAYFTSSLEYPSEYLQELDTVLPETLVTYSVNGDTAATQWIDENSIESPPSKWLINRKKGDVFTVKIDFPKDEIKEIEILSIWNKNLKLFREITSEFDNQLNGYPVYMMNFDELGIEGFEENMVEAFGADEVKREILINEKFKEYYQNQISFTQISIEVFNRNHLRAYEVLTSDFSDCFRAILPLYMDGSRFNNETRFVLDFSSLMCLYNLSQELGIVYKKHFVCSKHLRRTIEIELDEIKRMPESKMSLKVGLNGVQRIMHQEGNKDARIDYLTSIINWIDQYCTEEIVKEKLNDIYRSRKGNNPLDDFFSMIIDNMYLSLRENHYLLTDDSFYYTELKGNTEHILCTQFYLSSYYKNNEHDINYLLLRKRYVGILLDEKILEQEFDAMLAGRQNNFSLCLENLNYRINPRPSHIGVTVKFVQLLFLKAVLREEQKIKHATDVFVKLLDGLDPAQIKVLRNEVSVKFNLLGTGYLQVLKSLMDAVNIIHLKNNS